MTLTLSGVKVKVIGQGQGHVTPHFDWADARNVYLMAYWSGSQNVPELATCQSLLAPCQFEFFITGSL